MNGHTIVSRLRGLWNWLAGEEARPWILRALYAYATVGFVLWMQTQGDFGDFLRVGQVALAGGHVYADLPEGGNTWPPFFSLICALLARAAAPAPLLARAVWILLNYACLLLALRTLARLVWRREFSLKADSAGLSAASPELFVPLLLSGRFLIGSLDHLQMDIVLFALLLGGLGLQARGWPVLGGAMIGAAAAVRGTATLFLPYLAHRRRGRAAACAAATWAALSLSPILVYGWRQYWEFFAAWLGGMAAYLGVGRTNQSLFAMLDRLVGYQLVPLRIDGTVYLPPSGSPAVTVLTLLAFAVTVLAAFRLFRGEDEPDSPRALLEWSVVFIGATIFGPICVKAQLLVLLLPFALLFSLWRSEETDAVSRRIAALVLLASFVLGTGASPGMIGPRWAGRTDMASAVTLSALVVLLGCFWLHRRLARRPGPGAAEPAAAAQEAPAES